MRASLAFVEAQDRGREPGRVVVVAVRRVDDLVEDELGRVEAVARGGILREGLLLRRIEHPSIVRVVELTSGSATVNTAKSWVPTSACAARSFIT